MDSSMTPGHHSLSEEDPILNSTSIIPPEIPTSVTRPCEDFQCSICMDYLMDAVQTSCSHKFCKFCIERWINVNPSRRCPICRGTIGEIRSIPELDANIASILQNIMSQDELAQRAGVRDQRARVVANRERIEQDPENYYDNSWLSDTVESHLVSNALRNSLYAAQQELQHRNAHLFRTASRNENLLDNPWTAQSTTSIISRLRESIERLHELQDPLPAHSHRFHELQENFNYSENEFLSSLPVLENVLLFTNEGEMRDSRSFPTTVPLRPQASFSDNSQRRHQAHMRTMIEDNLVIEYNYHIRRVESAHSRIQEAQHDFQIHNRELIIIFDKFVANQNEGIRERERHAHVNNESVEDLHIRGIPRNRHVPSRSRSARRRSLDRLFQDTDNESRNASSFARLRRDSRWSRGLQSEDQNNNNYPRLHRFSPNETIRRDPSSLLSFLPESDRVHQGNSSGQNLRVTREEVHLPTEDNNLPENIQQGRLSESRRISSTNHLQSPIRTWSESTRRRYPHLDLMISESRARRRSVQFRSESNNSPDHEFSSLSSNTPTNNYSREAPIRLTSSRPLVVLRPMQNTAESNPNGVTQSENQNSHAEINTLQL